MALKKWGAWVAGKILRKKLKRLGVLGGTMTDKKKWWQSRGVWAGLIVTVQGLYALVDANLGPVLGFDLPPIPLWINTFLGALGVYGRVKADKKIENG